MDLVKLTVREHLTVELLAELPGIDDKLLAQGDQAWLQAFLGRVSGGPPTLKPATWAFLAPRAARSAKTVEDRAKVCEALVHHPISEAAPELVNYFLNPLQEFADPDELLRTAVKAMSAMGAKRELFRVVTEYGQIQSDRRLINPNITRDAFVALVGLKARPEILVIAQSESGCAGEAVQTLVAMDHPDRSADLLKLLSTKNIWARHHAAVGLGKLAIQEARPGLLALLAEADGPSIRGAVDALSRLGAREAIPRMLPLLRDSRTLVQVETMRSLAALGAKEAVPHLFVLLTHREPAVRAVAAESLAHLQGKEAVQDLLPLLQDPVGGVRLYAAAALCEAGSTKGLPLVLRLTEKADPVWLPVGDLMSGGGLGPPPALLTLNAIRFPEAWKRLLKASVSKDIKGTVLPDAEILAQLMGMKLEISPEVSRFKDLSERRYIFEDIPQGMPLRELMNTFCLMGFQPLFDGAVLRLVLWSEAITEWKQWFIAREPADAGERAEVEAFKEEVRRAALPPVERAALEARDKDDVRNLHRKERARALNGVLTPGMRRYEERLLDGGDDTWAAIGRELLTKQGQDHGLAEADLDVLIPRAIAAVKNESDRLPPYKITEDRLALLGLAKRRTSKDIPAWIQDLLQDPAHEMRSAALNLLDPKQHAKEILGFSKDPSSRVRLVVATLVSDTYPRESLDLMVELSLDPEWGVSDRAAFYLQYRAGPDLIPHMIKLLKRSTSNDQAATSALSFLGRHGARESIPQILPLLDQEQTRCRYPAVQALLELGARESLPRILGVLRKSNDSLYLAMPLIEAFELRESVPDLYRLLEGENNFQNDLQKGKVVLTLARMGDRNALPTIRKLLHNKFGPLRAGACNALALLDGPAARKTVLEAFGDPDVTPFEALVLTDAREAIPELRKRLGGYGAELISTLVDLEARDALPQIFAILDKPEEAAAYYFEGLRAAARGFPKESLPSLRINLAAKSSAISLDAACLICEAGSAEGVPLLIEMQQLTFSLNALRTPETWRKLRDLRLEGTLYGSIAQLLERVAREAGLTVEGLPADALDHKAWTGRHVFLPKGARPLRLIEVIDHLEDPRWAFVLEKDRIRVLPRDAALAFWKEWAGPIPKK